MCTSRSTEFHLGVTMNYHPFKVDWLDSSLQETLFPGKPWHKVYEKLGAALAREVEGQLKNPEQRQIIFQLLGLSFVQEHFSNYLDHPSLLHPPNMTASRRELLEQDTRVWLQDVTMKAAEQCGCQRRPGGDYSGLSSEMIDFIDDTNNLVFMEMEQLLARHEAKQNDPDTDLAQSSITWQSSWAMVARRRPKSVESKDLHLTMRRGSAFQLKLNDGDSLEPKLNPPPLSCMQSETLGDSVCAILRSDRERMPAICERLRGKLLPTTLRCFIWLDKLLKMDKQNRTTASVDVEKTIRERFGRVIERRMAELKLRSATRSPVSGLVENAVVQKFEKTPCMQPFATNEQMILEASKTLNVLYVYDGTYEPYLIYWLFPLQIAFKQSSAKAEHPYELAMYLHLLIHNLFPSWPEVFGMAEQVMNRLEKEDPEFFAHLHSCFTNNVLIEPKEFLLKQIAREKAHAQKLHDTRASSEELRHISKELLTNPIIVLRKWMGEGFAGILDLPAVLLIWDQLFMQDWKLQVMEDFCLAILLLLKEPLMAADDHHSLKQVFLVHASHLYTVDIQRSWIHLQQGGLPADIPGLNQLKLRNLYGPFPKNKGALTGISNDTDFKGTLGEILPIGLKNILVKLILLKSTSEERLKEFNPLVIKLTVSMFYGNLKLRSKSSLSKPTLLNMSMERTSNGAAVTELTLKFDENFEFELIDPSEFKVMNPTEDQPCVIISLLYCPTVKDFGPVPLGWIKVDPFHQETTATRLVWAPHPQSLVIVLYPGKVPDNITDGAPAHSSTELVHQGSEITLTAYDPYLENRRQRDQETEGERFLSSDERFLTVPWVAHNSAVALPHPAMVNEPFDLYLDAIRYIPDNATITKVTGRIMRSGRDDLPDILAFPILNSPARSPEFRYCMTVNVKGRETLDPNVLILLRVYTIDSDTGDLVVIGNTMVSLFNERGELNVGGFQLKLRGGMPSKEQTPLTASSLNHQATVPCCSLLIRLLPHTQDPVPPPDYLSGFYFTEDAKPNKSELEVISSFQKDKEFPISVGNAAAQLMSKERTQVPPEHWMAWYEERLDGRKHLLPQQPPAHLSTVRMVRYRQRAGIRLRISQVYGLKGDGLYVSAFARILKGGDALRLPETAESGGRDEKFLTRQHDFTSLQRSPRWIDPSWVLHPYWDIHSVLLIQIFGINVIYTPDRSGQQPGQVTSRTGEAPELDALLQLGWSAVPLFYGPYVKTGVHNAPLFQGSPDAEFLDYVLSHPVKYVMGECLKKKTLRLTKEYSSIVIEMWDGHYFDDEHCDLPVIDDLLTIDKMNKFLKVQSSKKGKDMTQLVLQSLDRRIQKTGRNHPEYKYEEQFFEEAMAETFYALVETALMNAGYGPL
ncbi:uncharacterized protein [Heptranchias perlo]|uniref:uncharacterized protein n=1 Tax=Heptranchias perlo TaxID=212740 RepID=UPI00355A7027